MKKLPIGKSDFKKIREDNYYYVDKSLLIHEILDVGAEVTLFTRPRRFGKTLNMSMLYSFFDIKNSNDNRNLFKGLDIEKSEYFSMQGQYPVIALSFKDLKSSTWDDCYKNLQDLIKDIFRANVHIYEKLDAMDKKEFDNIREKSQKSNFAFSLKYLSQLLYEYYNKEVIILIDEYDTPIISAYSNNYYKEAMEFFRNFYSAAMKDNDHLQLGVMTGILRVAKEGIFSGLNNLDVDTILNKRYCKYFGLTENDVNEALRDYNLENEIDSIREWYNGYLFGDINIYNPWSIIKYLNTKNIEAYWVNTSDNFLINKVLNISDDRNYDELVDLFNGNSIRKYISNDISFDNLKGQNSLWALMLFSGYLTIENEKTENEDYLLKIPNKEIYSFFEKSFIVTKKSCCII
jgi:hypothetical protein